MQLGTDQGPAMQVALSGPLAVECSIAVENRRLYRGFVSRLLQSVLDTIAPL